MEAGCARVRERQLGLHTPCVNEGVSQAEPSHVVGPPGVVLDDRYFDHVTGVAHLVLIEDTDVEVRNANLPVL